MAASSKAIRRMILTKDYHIDEYILHSRILVEEYAVNHRDHTV